MGRLAFSAASALFWRGSEAPLRGPEPADAPAPKAMAIEAAAGTAGVGFFLVENSTAESVSTSFDLSALADGAGREVSPTVRFSPDKVTLEPGDQALVALAVVVDETLEPDVRYGGEVTIPGLVSSRVPISVRRPAVTETNGS
jgi:hypothetical protein